MGAENTDTENTGPTAAMLVIGDEILSGRTRDANLHHLAVKLSAAGIDLREARIVSDDARAIIEAVSALSSRYDHVFTSGGIGPTHDDITADCVASAFGRTIGVREDARRILADYYAGTGRELNDARLRMARIPDGARLIANSVSGAPGFILENVHVMAGVPAVFEAMLAEVMQDLDGGPPEVSRGVRIDRPEGEIAGLLAEFAAARPGIRIGCYPFEEGGRYGANLVLRGRDEGAVEDAARALRVTLAEEAG